MNITNLQLVLIFVADTSPYFTVKVSDFTNAFLWDISTYLDEVC